MNRLEGRTVTLWELDGMGKRQVKHPAVIFLRFGSNYDEFEDGVGNHTTAIVMLPDGSIEDVVVRNISFSFTVYQELLKG